MKWILPKIAASLIRSTLKIYNCADDESILTVRGRPFIHLVLHNGLNRRKYNKWKVIPRLVYETRKNNSFCFCECEYNVNNKKMIEWRWSLQQTSYEEAKTKKKLANLFDGWTTWSNVV